MEFTIQHVLCSVTQLRNGSVTEEATHQEGISQKKKKNYSLQNANTAEFIIRLSPRVLRSQPIRTCAKFFIYIHFYTVSVIIRK